MVADSGSTTAVTGNVTVVQPTGTNLHAVLDTTSTTAVTQATAGNLNATVVGTGTFAAQVTGTVTANAGTNLNTSALALDATVANTQVAGGGTTAPSKVGIVGGKTNDGTPQYDAVPEGAGGRSVIVEGFAGGTAVPVSLASAPVTHVVVDSGNLTSNQNVAVAAALPAGSNVIGHVVTDSGSVTTATGSGVFEVAPTTAANTLSNPFFNQLSDGTHAQTFMSTTTSSKYGADFNLLSILGTAPTSAGFLDIKGADGNVFVRQATGSNLHVVCDSGCSSSAGFTDNSAFTVGTSAINPIGGLYDTGADPTIANGNAGRARIDSHSYLYTDLATPIPAGSNVIGHVVADSGSTTAVTGVVEVAPTGSANTKTNQFFDQLTDGTNAVTVASTTTSSKFGLDTNILSILGTAPTTAGKLDVKGADGDVFVRQATGSNLHTVLDSGTLTGITNHVTVDAGTNLNTSALALDASVTNTQVSEGTVAPSKLQVVGGETNDGTPQYDYLPLGTGGRTVIVEGFAGGTAVPVSLASAPTTHVIVDSGNLTSNQNVTVATALPAGSAVIGHVIDDSGSVTNATLQTSTGTDIGNVGLKASQTLATLTTITNAVKTNADTTQGGTTAPTNSFTVGGKTNDGTAQYQDMPLGTGGRSVVIEGVASGTAVPISGAVTVSSGSITASCSTACEVSPTTAANTVSNPFYNVLTDNGGHASTYNSSTYSSKYGIDVNLLGVGGALFSATNPLFGTLTDGAHAQTFMSTTTSSKYGADTNILSILGTAPTTAGKIDVKGADGDVFVRSQTAANFLVTDTQGTSPWVVSNGGTFAVQGTDTVSGPDAAGAAPTKNPLQIGGIDNTSNCSSGPCVQKAVFTNGSPIGNEYGLVTTDKADSAITYLLSALLQAQKNVVLKGTFGVPLGSVGNALLVSPVQTDPCSGLKQNIPITQTANTKYLTGAGHRIYLCEVFLVGSDAENISIVEGTGTTCGTSTVAVVGGATAANGPNLAANGGWVQGNGGASVASTNVPGDDVCIFESGSGRVAGNIEVAFGQ